MGIVPNDVTAHRETDVVPHEDRELALENERLRRENRILREERGTRHMDEDTSPGHEEQQRLRTVELGIVTSGPPDVLEQLDICRAGLGVANGRG